MPTMQEVLISSKNELSAVKLAQTLAMIEQESALNARLSAPLDLSAEGVAKLAFQANLEAGLSLDVLNQEEAQALELNIPPGSALFSMALYGKLTSNLKASSVLSPVFHVAATAEADAELRVSNLFFQPATKTLAEAILDCAHKANLPLSLDQAFGLLQVPQWQQTRWEVDGKLQTGLGLNAGYQATGKTWTVNGDNALPVGVSLGLNGYLKVQLAGVFHLAVMRHGNDLRVRLHRERKRSRDFGLKLGAEADFSIVLNDVAGLLSASLPNPEKYQKTVLALLEPGSSLIQALAKFVDENINNDTLKQIVKLELSLQDGSVISAGIKAHLDQAVLAYFNGEADRLHQALRDVLTQVVPDHDRDELLSKIADYFDLDKIMADKIQALSELFSASASYAEVVKELGAFGGVLRDKIVDLNASVNQSKFAMFVKQSLQAYADLRKKWLTALTDAAHAKLALNFASNVSLSEENDTLLDVLFHPLAEVSANDKSSAEHVYAALLSGRLDNFLTELNAAQASVTLLGGALQSKLTRLQQATLDLNLFGLNLSWSSSASAKLALKGTARGELIAVTGSAGGNGTTTTWNGNCQTKLGCEFSYIPGQTGASYNLSFKGSFTYDGQNLSANDLDKMLASLSFVCDLPGKADFLDRLGLAGVSSTAHGQGLYDLDLILPINLSPQAIIKFTQNQDLPQIACTIALELADAHYHDSLHFLHDLPSDLIVRGAAEHDQSVDEFIVNLRGQNDLVEILYKLAPDAPTSGSIASNPNLYRALIVRKIARLVNGIIAAQADIAKVGDILQNTQVISDIHEQVLFGVLQKISDDLKPAAVSSETALGNEHSMPWVLSAFALILATASRMAMPGAFAAVASTKSANGQVNTIVLGAI